MLAATRLSLAVCVLAACQSSTPKPGAPPEPGATGDAAFGAPDPDTMRVRTVPAVAIGDPGQPVQFVAFDAPRPRDASAPLSLTTGDGTGLELTRLDARAVVDGPLAFTELRLTFTNPEDRVLEGRFAITLPEGAAISRFAMKINGEWMEAEVVERQAARRAYEDALHRRQDPALLEKEAGNEFRARVFPIPAKGEKELIVSYSQELADPDQPYVLPLRGLPRIAEASARVQVARLDGGRLFWDVASLSERGWIPDRDLAVGGSGAAHALGTPGMVAMRVAPELPSAPEAMHRLILLVDTSASRALGFAAYATAIDDMVAALARDHAGLEVMAAAFDQSVEPLYAGPAKGAAGAIASQLKARRPLGASRLDSALAWAKGQGTGRLVVVTDGVVTAGDLDATTLGAATALLAPTIERVDVVLAGGIRERAVAEALTRGRVGRDGAVLDLDDGAAEVARRLGLATRSGITVNVVGARWSWPQTLDGLQPGDAAMVYAGFDDDFTLPQVTIELGAGRAGGAPQRRELVVEPAPGPLVTRAVVSAQVSRLEAGLGAITDSKLRAAQVEQIIALSTTHRVLSDHTALLVLETEADYQRFAIPRTALAGILVVGERGVEVQARQAPAVIAQPEPPPMTPTMRAQQERAKAVEAARTAGVLGNQAVAGGDLSAGFSDVDVASGVAPSDGIEGAAVRAGSAGDDDESEESGGTGTAMALEEGRMGRRDSDRAEGQYKMVAPSADPALERSAPRGIDSASLDNPLASAPRGRVSVGASAGGSAAAPPPPGLEPAQREQRIARPERRPAPRPRPPIDRDDEDDVAVDKKGRPLPYAGRLAKVMEMLAGKRVAPALAEAWRWRDAEPGDVLALIALGEAFEAGNQRAAAARAYGSIIDLFPARADLRRFAGERLDRLAVGADGADARALAVDTYQRAVEQRPDHLSGHHLLAFALLRAGRPADAFAALERGLAQTYPSGRFAGGNRILVEDLGLIGAAWLRSDGTARPAIERRLAALEGELPRGPSLRFVLVWETDANDVDFHIRDARGGHAYYENMQLASGGELYADVTTGYGPECFTIPGKPAAAPYRLSIHYYSRGPMGYGMGKLQVLRHDGKGGITTEDRPFVVMNDQAFVELGTVR